MVKKLVKRYLAEVEEDIISIRRHLHRYPELSHQEYKTSKLVQEKLAAYHIQFNAGYGNTGVLGIIEGEKPGKTVALRADMDALPIQEKTDIPYKSTKPGVMHACGHDAHTAMLLGAAKILNRMKAHIEGKVLLVFQPAEEDAPIGGAQLMLDDGVFEKHQPDVIYGMHVWPDLPVGTIGIKQREMMGASDRFKITIQGRGGHASMPHQTNDAIVTAGYLITAMQSIVSRSINPLKQSVVTIGKIKGGYKANVIAEEVTLSGTVRTYDQEIKHKIKKRLSKICNKTAAMFESTIDMTYIDGYEATINTPRWASLVRQTAIDLFGNNATPEVEPALTAEDFSRYLKHYPGAFIWLGTQVDYPNEQKALHNPEFKLNEKALPLGSELLVHLVLNTLKKLNGEVNESKTIYQIH